MQTSLAARAMEGLSDPKTRGQVIEGLHKYLDTDTIWCGRHLSALMPQLPRARAGVPRTAAEPALATSDRLDQLDVRRQHSCIRQRPVQHEANGRDASQARRSPRAVRRMAAGWHVLRRSLLTRAAFERAVLSTKSFLIALGITQGRLTVEQAAQCAHVEVQSQIDRWGEVEDSSCRGQARS